jgi:hypothetical protein
MASKEKKMKNVKWQDCETWGATHNNPSQNPILGDGEVTSGMRVCAHYKNLYVYLQIKSQIQEDVFAATVLFFEPVDSGKPHDLDKEDEVIIDRKHICWLSGN